MSIKKSFALATLILSSASLTGMGAFNGSSENQEAVNEQPVDVTDLNEDECILREGFTDLMMKADSVFLSPIRLFEYSVEELPEGPNYCEGRAVLTHQHINSGMYTNINGRILKKNLVRLQGSAFVRGVTVVVRNEEEREIAKRALEGLAFKIGTIEGINRRYNIPVGIVKIDENRRPERDQEIDLYIIVRK